MRDEMACLPQPVILPPASPCSAGARNHHACASQSSHAAPNLLLCAAREKYRLSKVPAKRGRRSHSLARGNQHGKPALTSTDSRRGLPTGQRGEGGFSPPESALPRFKRQRLCVTTQAAACLPREGRGNVSPAVGTARKASSDSCGYIILSFNALRTSETNSRALGSVCHGADV